MTLRNRVSVAAAAGVLIVVAAVSGVLYLSYAASLRARLDASLIDAAQQASGLTRTLKKSAASHQSPGFISQPVTVGSVSVQLFPDAVAGQSTPFGPLDDRDLGVADQGEPAYFANARDQGRPFRVYTAVLPPGNGLVRASRAANADDGALRTGALLLAGLTVAATGVTYGAARLTAGRVLRPIATLTDLNRRLNAPDKPDLAQVARDWLSSAGIG